ncbi:recombinase family protein [Clostridium beijerinckii]|uniref:Recombinase family protein n=1 Tax=Clostridium beijerinckii TaxID=1520 RepID=A0A7X9SSB3_CLOBE|nr:recombinase family protein [Clostridium beijerinckii]NMF06868.1 recombinase family protein [Clostridium beijerinckii]
MEEKRVVIYARQSKFKENSESCINQILQCKTKIDHLNADPRDSTRYTVIQELIDDGFSGKSLDRPNMQKFIKMVERNEVDIIFAYKLDRVSRNMKDVFWLLDKLQKHKVDIISFKEKEIDTTGATGKAFFAINMVFAQLERDLASERSKDNNVELAKRGQFMGSYVKYGHTAIKEEIGQIEEGRSKTKTLLTWNKEEAEVVKNTFAMYLEGNNSFSRIAKMLNDDGIPKKQEWKQPKKNNKWIESNIANMIKDINYCENTIEAYNYFKKQGFEFLVDIEKFSGGKSLQKYDGKITILNVKPIVSASTYINAQKMRDSKRTTRNHVLPYQSDILLGSGILVCHECGKHLGNAVTTKKVKNGTKEYRYYHCYNKECGQCGKMSHIKMDELDKNVLNRLKEFFPNKELIKNILEADYNKKNRLSEEEERMKQIIKKIEGLDRLINNMNTAIANLAEQENDEDVQSLIATYQSQQIQAVKKKKELRAELETLNLEVVEEKEHLYEISELLDRVDNLGEVLDKSTEENRKRLVHFLVKNIVVRSDQDFDMNMYFYEDLPKPEQLQKCLDNDCTPQGVRWKKID